MENKDSIKVYWAIGASIDRQTLMNLLWEPPTPLLHSLPNKDAENYTGCKAVSTTYKNTYVINHALTAHIRFNETEVESSMGAWILRQPSFKDAHTVEYDYNWYFFAEEPVFMELTPPFMHKTSVGKTGYLTAGGFDISKWFRAVTLTYQLWEKEKELVIQANEPAAYVHFKTDKKVSLQQFSLTEDLLSISSQTVGFKNIVPNQSLDALYDRFTRSKRDKEILSLIKKNLL